MITFIQNLLAIGTHPGLTASERKAIRLLNFFCVIWQSLIPVFLIADYFHSDHFLVAVGINLYHFVFLGVVLFLNRRRKYFIARLMLVGQLYIGLMAFALLVTPGMMVELYLILIPILAIIFFENKHIQFAALFLALSSIGLIGYLNHHPGSLLSQKPHLYIIIFANYVFFRHVKKSNIENEEKLIQQKDEVNKLYNFQNRFFNNIAHEIRTPLTIIKGGIVKAEKEGASAKTIQSLTVQTGNIQDIVRDVLDLTKMDSNNFVLNHKSVNISALVYRTYYSFSSNFAQKKIEYKFLDNTHKNMMVGGDENYLSRAVANLLRMH